MLPERIEALRHEYMGEPVVVDASRPELARFAGKQGRVVTITAAAKALVEFGPTDRARYDIELDYLKVVDRPADASHGKESSSSNGSTTRATSLTAEEEKEDLSALERARLENRLRPLS